MSELADVEGVIVDAVQLGKLFDCTREHISRLHKVHGMPKHSRGRFNLVECVQWYVDYKHNSKKVGSEERDLKNKLVTAQQLRVDIENKTKLGELLPVDEVAAKFNAMMSVVASQLDALGPRCAPRVASMDSVAECQKVIFDEARAIRRAAAAEIETLADLDDGGGDTQAPPNRHAGEWADAERVLPRVALSPVRGGRHGFPYWRRINEASIDPEVDLVVGCMGSQMSKTEGMLNVIGHRLDDGPYVPIIYVGPTEKLVKSMSRDRIDKMLRSSKSLWGKTEKGNRYGIAEKYVSGVRLGFAWAGSPTEMASHPCGLMLIDERSRMSSDVGGEGDPVVLARARTKNYAFSKILVFSTPLIEGSDPTWALLDQSTCEFWAVPCKHCLEFFVPQISLLHWPKGLSADDASAQARLVCPNCGGEHETRDKEALNAGGTFIQHRKLADRENAPDGLRKVLEHYIPRETPKKSRQVGIWVSGLCSPWASFEYLAFNLINAYASKDPDTIQAVVNTDGGELFRVRGDAPEWQEVANNKLEYPPEVIPDPQVQVITLGADVQKYGIYVTIRGWGPAAESWLLYHDYLVGETEYDDIWIKLGNLLTKEIGGKRIVRAFIDSGYRPGDTHNRPDHAVYSFCRRHRGLAYPTKGRDTMDRPFKFSDIDYSVGGKLIKNGVRLYHINTDHFKSWIHARVTWPESEHGGGWHLHNQTTEDYCKQIVSEELVIKSSGKKMWIKIASDNHYLDAEVGCTAAAYSLNVHQLVKKREPQPDGNAQQTPAKQAPKRRPGYDRESLF